MILASAQTNPIEGDIKSNLSDHYNIVEIAAKNDAELIVFPELSITGYTRNRASDLSFTPNDDRLNELKRLSANHQIVIIAGAPINIENKLYIGSFIIKPNNSVEIYTKQFLHEGEDLYYLSSFNYNPTIQIQNEFFSFAICADINHAVHASNAKNKLTTFYIASIFFSLNGMTDAFESLSGYAKNNQMCVLMSNFCGNTWGMKSGGQSTFWDKNGKLIHKLPESDSGLLIVEKKDNIWVGQTITV